MQQKGVFRSVPMWSPKIPALAALNGHLETLKYLVTGRRDYGTNSSIPMSDRSCPWDDRTCRNAALGGHIDVLQYTVENGCLCPNTICEEAVLGGNLACLKWLTEKHLSSKICSASILAIVHGKDEILEYLIENDYPIYEGSDIIACKYGRLGKLKLLKEKGFFIREDCIDVARKMDHVLEWWQCINSQNPHNLLRK